jgi:DNA gyrase/topoisomerase IV subunit A
VTKQGKSIRFPEGDVRSTGRDTMGVRGILLASDDYVVAMKSSIKTISEDKKKRSLPTFDRHRKGMGKRTL